MSFATAYACAFPMALDDSVILGKRCFAVIAHEDADWQEAEMHLRTRFCLSDVTPHWCKVEFQGATFTIRRLTLNTFRRRVCYTSTFPRFFRCNPARLQKIRIGKLTFRCLRRSALASSRHNCAPPFVGPNNDAMSREISSQHG